MMQSYKRHLSIYNHKMQLSKDLHTKVEIMEKLAKLEEELISKRDDPSFSQAKNAATILNMCHTLQEWVAKSVDQGTNEL
jgi:hypothetical protein